MSPEEVAQVLLEILAQINELSGGALEAAGEMAAPAGEPAPAEAPPGA